MRLVERAAVDDAVHLLANGFLVGFAPVFELNFRHSPAPNSPRKRQPSQHRSAVSYRYILGLEGAACHASGMIVNGHSTIRKEPSHEKLTSNHNCRADVQCD